MQAHPGAAGYIADADRFHTDVVGEETARRRAEYERKQSMTEAARKARIDREESRWSDMDERTRREEERYGAMREEGVKAKKNAVSAAAQPLIQGLYFCF